MLFLFLYPYPHLYSFFLSVSLTRSCSVIGLHRSQTIVFNAKLSFNATNTHSVIMSYARFDSCVTTLEG